MSTGNDGGGNPRFKGAGMQWKTPWKGHQPLLQNMPFIEGFSFNFPTTYGVYYNFDNPPPLTGSGQAPTFWRGAVIFIKADVGLTSEESVGMTETSPQPAPPKGGWRIFIDQDGAIKFEVGATSGAYPFATTGPGVAQTFICAPDQVTPAIVIPLLGIFRGDGTTISLFQSGSAQTPGSFAGLAYQDPTIGQLNTACGLGADASVSGGIAEHLGINGLVGGPGIPSVGQIAQWFDDVKTQLTTPIIPGMTTDQWTANPYIGVNEYRVAAPSFLVDQVGTQKLSAFAGTPTPLTITNYQALFNY